MTAATIDVPDIIVQKLLSLLNETTTDKMINQLRYI